VYGRLEPTTTLRMECTGTAPLWLTSVFWTDESDPAASVTRLPVWFEAGCLSHALGVRIGRQHSTDYLVIAEPTSEGADTRWRVGELETDARVLLCRIRADGAITRLLMVDGSFVRAGGRQPLQLALDGPVSDFHADLASVHADGRGPVRVAGPPLGAQLLVSGRERGIDLERRAAPRPANAAGATSTSRR
jgi:hypothetical protein